MANAKKRKMMDKMETLNILKDDDFADRKNKAALGRFSSVLSTEENFRILLSRYNLLINTFNSLAVKVWDLEQALKKGATDGTQIQDA